MIHYSNLNNEMDNKEHLRNEAYLKKQICRGQSKKLSFIFLCFCFAISFSFSVFAQEQTERIDNELIEIKDTCFYFKAYVPKNWIMEETKSKDSFFRLVAYSPTEKQSISFYSLRAKDNVSPKKLAKNLKDFFSNIGEVIDEKSNYFHSPEYHERVFYDKETALYSKIRCFAYFEFGYIIMAKSYENDFAAFDACFNKTDGYSPLRDESTKKIIWLIVFFLIFMLSIPAGTGYLAVKTKKYKWGLLITVLISTIVHCGLLVLMLNNLAKDSLIMGVVIVFAMILGFGWQSRKKGKIWVITSLG